MSFALVSFNIKGLARGVLILVLIVSGLRPMPVSSSQAVLPGPVPAISGQKGSASALPIRHANFPTNQIILKYRPTAGAFSTPARTDQMARLNVAAGISMQYLREMSGNANVLRLPERLPLAQVQAISTQLMSLPEVQYAEPDRILFPTLTPNDPSYLNQWDLYTINGINAPGAWDITTGSNSLVVADIDTGITNHADLSGRTVPGYDFIVDSKVANDGGGRDADPGDPGDWITVAESLSGYFSGCSVGNSSWHGTHTAGTIGASGNNALGVTGINWNSRILPVRVLGKCGGYASDIIDALRWSAGLSVSGVPANPNPARVANLSLGENGSCSTAWQDAINDATAAGMVVVVAAGNSSSDASNFTPANCNNVITVAATNRNGSRASYSNYGSKVEISAPGGDSSGGTQNGILSTLNTGTTSPLLDTYAYYQGTSMATPHVTGVISLMFSVNRNLTPAQVLQILQDTARPFPTGSSCNTSLCGKGMLDAAAAVNAVTKISHFIPGCGLPGSTISINGTNFTGTSAVKFNRTSANFSVISDTTISATVPNGATTGPISVIAPGGTATSMTSFIVGSCYIIHLPLLVR